MAERVAQEFRLYGLLQTKPAAAMPSSGWFEALDQMHAARMNEAFSVSSQGSIGGNTAKSETTHMH